ncbi:MAG: competence/damage-inducible protein A [Actinomycetota bacterium]|nr:competence/damage-inducible protein A [Actinomycetota bacterium]MDQ3720172.1 competence/damage-inducible protein A [Actinomycetota bacterium]
MAPRAGIVVTGTEVLTGRVQDRNGPWLSDRLRELGVDLAHITICGDRPEDMEAQLRFLAAQGVDLIVTSGGLGPTADDLTTQVVAGFAGRPLFLDPDLERQIADILRPLMKRWPDLDFEAVRTANRKQAMVPEGALVISPAGTAPGLVVPPLNGSGPTVVVLPGPPRELHEMWETVTQADEFRAAIGRRTAYEQRMLRLFGIPESEMAETLRVAETQLGDLSGLEITTCLRRGEVEVVTRFEAHAAERYERLAALIAERHQSTLFSPDGSSVDDQVSQLLDGRRLALAESCTGGLMAARFTEVEGSSAYFLGGAVTYANDAKIEALDVPAELIERHGAVSPEVAEAMADGALARMEADTALSITGIAGPGGGTEAKPVGYVCWCAKLDDGSKLARDVRLPGDRAEVRDRATTVGMHLLRRLLRGEEPPV